MIDYFYYDYDKLREENIDPIVFFFGGQYPILDYQVHCSIDKDFMHSVPHNEWCS